jgi:hypothetical protein
MLAMGEMGVAKRTKQFTKEKQGWIFECAFDVHARSRPDTVCLAA